MTENRLTSPQLRARIGFWNSVRAEELAQLKQLRAEFEAWEALSNEALANFENSLPDEPYEIEITKDGYARIKEKTDAVDS